MSFLNKLHSIRLEKSHRGYRTSIKRDKMMLEKLRMQHKKMSQLNLLPQIMPPKLKPRQLRLHQQQKRPLLLNLKPHPQRIKQQWKRMWRTQSWIQHSVPAICHPTSKRALKECKKCWSRTQRCQNQWKRWWWKWWCIKSWALNPRLQKLRKLNSLQKRSNRKPKKTTRVSFQW